MRNAVSRLEAGRRFPAVGIQSAQLQSRLLGRRAAQKLHLIGKRLAVLSIQSLHDGKAGIAVGREGADELFAAAAHVRMAADLDGGIVRLVSLKEQAKGAVF